MLTREEVETIRIPMHMGWEDVGGEWQPLQIFGMPEPYDVRAIEAGAIAEANGHLPRGATAAIWAMVETGKVPVATTHVQCSRKFGQSAASATGTR